MLNSTQGFLEVDGGSLWYETAGQGDPVVLVHAGFLDRGMFDAQWDILAGRFNVIRFDMRGFGRSTPATGPICRRDDLARLLEHLGIRHAHFVGCSVGGQIVLDLALERPGQAKSLTLVASTPSGFELQGEPPRYLFEMIEAANRGDVDRASELQIRIWLDGSSREPGDIDPALRARALAMNRISVEKRTFLIADMQPARPLDPPAVSRLAEVACPALIVAGELDHPEVLRAAELMAAQIPGARQKMIAGAGHVPSFERPEEFTPLLLDFLDSV